MNCEHCGGELKLHGKSKQSLQRYRCKECKKCSTEEHVKPIGNMKLDFDKAEMCLRLLLEGNSIRSTERITGVNRNTLCDLVAVVGNLCEQFLKNVIQDVPVEDIQVDELWGFVNCKERTRKRLHPRNFARGDAYCYLAVERKTKLIVAWHLGKRSGHDTYAFMVKLRRATAGRFQLSTDGFPSYQDAVPTIMGNRVDFGVIVKLYGTVANPTEQRRYSSAGLVGVKRSVCIGQPKWEKISTSHVERANLTLRMGMRRLTRLTNGFSKTWAQHEAAHSMFFAAYNFVRVHSTLKQTPAMAAGLTDHAWTVRELLERAAELAA